jgi:hypothetical protein
MTTTNQRSQITVDGKVYGYVTNRRAFVTLEIRSESNPHKTPYLKIGSAVYNKVKAAIIAAENAA